MTRLCEGFPHILPLGLAELTSHEIGFSFGHSSDELEVQAYSLVRKSETFGHLSKILDS